jgi:phosphomannomutase
MSAPTGFGSQDLRGVVARDFASLTPLGVENSDRVKWFYDKARLIFRASGMEPVVRIYAEATSPDLVQVLLEETRGLLQPRCVCISRPAFHAVE